MEYNNQPSTIFKASLWLSFCFYFLIAFEFFYMISPFAAYLYSVYGPGLDLFSQSPLTNWLTSTFLPHIVNDTRSSLLNNIVDIGFILFFLGLSIFLWSAGQIYWGKLRRKQVVSSGLYTFVRHPQYSALMICGLGMLLLWPRYIVLVTYITMLFVYVLLARLEEQECLRKYGSSYRKYRCSTPMFFPLFPVSSNRTSRKLTMLQKIAFVTIAYLATVSTAITCANGVRGWSLDQLYAEFTPNSVNISVQAIEKDTIGSILSLAIDNSEVRKLLSNSKANEKFINYILPMGWSASEIPMRQVEGQNHFEHSLKNNREQYKVIITKAELTRPDATGKEIIFSTRKRIPVAEVAVDFHNKKVLKVQGPVEETQLEGIPLPLY